MQTRIPSGVPTHWLKSDEQTIMRAVGWRKGLAISWPLLSLFWLFRWYLNCGISLRVHRLALIPCEVPSHSRLGPVSLATHPPITPKPLCAMGPTAVLSLAMPSLLLVCSQAPTYSLQQSKFLQTMETFSTFLYSVLINSLYLFSLTIRTNTHPNLLTLKDNSSFTMKTVHTPS